MTDPVGRWTAERVHELVARRLGPEGLVVVSNREPYLHELTGGELRCVRPVSGLVSALDPILQAAGGVWVAHGGAAGDRKAVDPWGRVPVPPERPRYTLRRVWLTEDEEQGYYDGFANQTLWPLCHIAYRRPAFRSADWQQYQAVNAHFARAVLEESRAAAAVWIHDYHLALLPRLIRRERPDVRLAHFWHIPWPSPEVFRICPWRRELLDGLLANDVLGFHIRYHCDNFLDTVARELEARVDRERSAVIYGGHTSLVRPYPIGVDADGLAAAADGPEVAREMARLRTRHDLGRERLVVGLDRFDYTKGIPERLAAVERLLDRHPEWAGRLRFVQAGVPSRARIPAYRALGRQMERLVRRINARHGGGRGAPVLLLDEHLSPEAILALYRLADCLMVTSLHDGMNLVAKEYVAARTDGDGTLLLSEFTGAARELGAAYLVNPFDVDATADTLHRALTAPEAERRVRMSRLRERVEEWNIYRWAGEALDGLLRRPVHAEVT